MAVSIAKLAIQFVADTSGMHAGIGKAQTALGGFVKYAKGAGVALAGMGLAAATTAVTMFAREVRQSFDEIDDLAKSSKKLGIGVGELQQLGYAADLSGVSATKLNVAVVKLLDTVGEASMGSKRAAASFESLGVSVQSLKGKSPRDMFVLVADALAKVEDPALRTKMAIDILGRSAADLMPLLLEGRKGLNKLFAERGEMGLLTDADAAAIERANDAWSRMKGFVKSAADEVAVSLAPGIEAAAASVIRMFVEFRNWRDSLPDHAVGSVDSRGEKLRRDLDRGGFRGDGSNNPLGIYLRPDLAGRALGLNMERQFLAEANAKFNKPITASDLMSAEERNRIKASMDAKNAETLRWRALVPPMPRMVKPKQNFFAAGEEVDKLFGSVKKPVVDTVGDLFSTIDRKANASLASLTGGVGDSAIGNLLDSAQAGLQTFANASGEAAANVAMLSAEPVIGQAAALERGSAAAFSQARANAASQQEAEKVKEAKAQTKILEKIEKNTGVNLSDLQVAQF